MPTTIWAKSNYKIAPGNNTSFFIPDQWNVMCRGINHAANDLPALSGAVSGTVKVNAVAVAGYTVRIYKRSNGQLYLSGVSDSSGAFSLSGRGLEKGAKYFAIAFDDLTQSPDYNAQVLDLILPV